MSLFVLNSDVVSASHLADTSSGILGITSVAVGVVRSSNGQDPSSTEQTLGQRFVIERRFWRKS